MDDKTVLEQANAALAEAREVLKRADENLKKSQSINEVMMVQNRRLGFALSSLLPKPYLVGIDVARSEKELVMTPIIEPFEHREVYDVIHAINVLAMVNTDVLHVFSRFSGHVNEFNVRVCSTDSDYIDSRPECIFNEGIYLEQEDALEKLLSIESQLTELIIEAREQAEAKAEVNA